MRTIIVVAAVAVLILGFAAARLAVVVYTDWLWFGQLGFAPVMETMLSAKATALVVFWALFVLLAGGNTWAARVFGRRTRELPLEVIAADTAPELPERLKRQRLLWAGVVVGVGLVMGVVGTTVWISALRFLHPQSFGVADPIFGQDVGFYVFRLPVYNFLQVWLIAALIVTAGVVGASYYQDRSLRNDGSGWFSTPYVRAHFSVLAAGVALLLAWGYWLKEYDLLYSFRKDAFVGAGYADVHAQLPIYRVMLVLSLGLAGLLLYNLREKGWRLLARGALGYIGLRLVLSGILPLLFEQFVVKPNELALETPYIQHAIDFTRRAFALDRIREVPFPAETDLTEEDIRRNRTTVASIPLWDRRPLMDTYSQLQEIRSYYRFGSVDVDRYHVNGIYRQVMLAAREFSREQLSLQGETWVNRHLVYTHGYGLCMSPASEIGGEGLPVFYIKNIPPVSPVGIQIPRPEIYYGEAMRHYVIVRTNTQEFDYPRGDRNVYTTYEGRGGVPISSFFRRALFALRFADPYLLVTDALRPDSRIMLNRHIGRRFIGEEPLRFKKLAPFLKYDGDPYLVAADNRLLWIQDAYTVTTMYPYSQPHGRPYVREANYIRNSVKAVLDAYDGTVTFYVWDDEDPLVRAYAEIFPTLFRPGSEMPEAVRAHVRYPTDLFVAQAALYNVYHMTSPQVFYNREDEWTAATELYGISERPQTMDPYYAIVKLTGAADREEFVLMLPATPIRKDNMIAWLFARCDAPNYGELMVYKLPKEKLIYGPMLVERRIDQNTDVSREITLWSQRGSDVIRGHLLVIPIENSFIYVEPLYLRATQSGMPELKRVLAVHGEQLAMGTDLNEALGALFGEARAAERRSGPADAATMTGTLSRLARSAMDHLDEAQKRLREGDFGGYGEAIDRLRTELGRLYDRVARDEAPTR